jgi:hypothetical protein
MEFILGMVMVDAFTACSSPVSITDCMKGPFKTI